jgi:hypothetical protein
MDDNNNISQAGSWGEYGRLVLKELERLNEGQEKLRKDLEDKFTELNEKISDFKNTEKEVEEIKYWKKEVIDVWSVAQMKQSKDEIYEQKNMWTKVIGISIGVQAVIATLLYFISKIL